MTWTKITSQSEHAPSKVALTLSVSAKGKATMFVAMASPLAAQLGFEAEPFANAYHGEGEDAGLLWLQPSAEGFKVGQLKKAFVVRLPVPAGVPLKPARGSVDYRRHPDGGIIIPLPQFLLPSTKPGAPEKVVQSSDRPGALEISGNVLSMGAKSLVMLKHEVTIMRAFIERFGAMVSKDDLQDALRAADPTFNTDDKMLDTWISKLRVKLEEKKFDLLFMPHRGIGWELRRAVA